MKRFKIFIAILFLCVNLSSEAEAGLLKKIWKALTNKKSQEKPDSPTRPGGNAGDGTGGGNSGGNKPPVVERAPPGPYNGQSGGVVNPKDFKKAPPHVDHTKEVITEMSILSGSEKVEYSKPEDFKKHVEKIAARGETISVTVRLPNPCSGSLEVTPKKFKTKPYTMISHETTTPSSPALPVGKYFDALVPMDDPNCKDTSEICKQSAYRWIDIEVPRDLQPGKHDVQIAQNGESVTVTLNVKDFTMPIKPSMPFHVPISNWATMLAHCPITDPARPNSRDECKKNDELSKMYNNILLENRMEPYENAITNDVVSDPTYKDNANECRNQSVSMPSAKGLEGLEGLDEILMLKNISEFQRREKVKAWLYSYDEPHFDQPGVKAALRHRLAMQKKYAPNVLTMVTSVLIGDDDINKNVDIYCPVVDQWDTEGFPKPEAYKGKEVWLYSSCMAHGCKKEGLNCGAEGTPNDPACKVEYDDPGTPDFMMDRPAVDQFAFFAQGYKYKTQGLLYYNAGMNYSKPDPWKNTYDFGGNGDGVLLYPLTGDQPAIAGVPARPAIKGRKCKWYQRNCTPTEDVPAVAAIPPVPAKKGKFGCTGDAIAPSIRMKLFKQASQNFEWMKGAPDQSKMESAVNKLVGNTKNWSHDLNEYEKLKELAFP